MAAVDDEGYWSELEERVLRDADGASGTGNRGSGSATGSSSGTGSGSGTGNEGGTGSTSGTGNRGGCGGNGGGSGSVPGEEPGGGGETRD